MTRFLPGAVALIVIVLAGVIHGLQTDRWGTSSDLADAAARLGQIPSVIGDWSGTDQEMDAAQLKIAGASAHVARVYVNRIDGSAVNVVILCGPPGPMSVHPPTVCLTGAGWSLTGSPQKRAFNCEDGTPAGEFWQGNFMREKAGIPTHIRTFWSWSTSGAWQAVASPRRSFAGMGHLYKIYLTVPMSDRTEPAAGDRVDEFAKLFLPRVNAIIQTGT